jgi:hypothetical protein
VRYLTLLRNILLGQGFRLGEIVYFPETADEWLDNGGVSLGKSSGTAVVVGVGEGIVSLSSACITGCDGGYTFNSWYIKKTGKKHTTTCEDCTFKFKCLSGGFDSVSYGKKQPTD